MKKTMITKLMSFLSTFIIFLFTCLTSLVYADEKASDNNTYYIDADEYNAGDNTGYSKKGTIDSKDPHYGWKLGQFVMTGFTGHEKDEDGNQVFLKTVGDNVTLSFELQQDISKLNGDEKKYIVGDKKGYDEYFGTKKTDFGKGALLIRYTSPDNKQSEPQIYTNFLTGESENAENMTVVLHEEGTYEVALDYKIEEPVLFVKPHDSYRMSFKFMVQNGNDMGFIRENGTGNELKNCSFTQNGFYIDLANSKYLNVQVKREELNSDGTELITDTRSNKVATDGESFTNEGIYTITVRNDYVDEPTTKTIYVGDNDLLKAYVVTGMPISDIQALLDDGATISEDGRIVQASVTIAETEIVSDVETQNDTEYSITYSIHKAETFIKSNKTAVIGIAALVVLIVIIIVFAVVRKKKRNKTKSITTLLKEENSDHDKEHDGSDEIKIQERNEGDK